MSVKVESHLVEPSAGWKHVRSDGSVQGNVHTLAMNVPGGVLVGGWLMPYAETLEESSVTGISAAFVPNAKVVEEQHVLEGGTIVNVHAIVESGKDA